MKLLLSFLLPVCLYSVMPHHETAFVGEPQSIYALFSYSYGQANHFWSKTGKSLKAYDDFRSQNVEAYMEYSLTPRDSVWGEVGYASTKEKYSGSKHKFRDSELAYKHIWWCERDKAFTTELRAIIPSGKAKLPVNYGEWGGQASVLYSQYFKDGWFDSLLGYRFYDGSPSDQLRAMGSIGYNIWSCFYFIGTAELEYGLQRKDFQYNRHVIAYNPFYRLLRLKGEILFSPYDYITISLGGYKNVWGRMIGEEGGFYVGSWLYY